MNCDAEGNERFQAIIPILAIVNKLAQPVKVNLLDMLADRTLDQLRIRAGSDPRVTFSTHV
jgi:hypothetical protein